MGEEQRAPGGSLFSLGDVRATALPDLLRFIQKHPSFRRSQARLTGILKSLFTLSAESRDGLVDRETLCAAVGIERPGLLHNIGKLEALGLISRARARPHADKRSVNLYTLHWPPLPVARLPDTPPRVALISEAVATRQEVGDPLARLYRRPNTFTCELIDPDNTTFKGERLTVFTLAPALAIGRQGRITEKTTRIWRGNRSFVVTVRSLAGDRIPNVEDLRPFVIAWTLARDVIASLGGPPPPNPVFGIPMRVICEGLGFKNPKANHLRNTFDRLRRLRSSEWQLTDDRYNVLRSFEQGGLIERDKYMSFISDLEVVSSVCDHGKTPELIALTFHPALGPALGDKSASLTIHQEFIQGNLREFDQLVYGWCRQFVQHKHELTEYPFERVYREGLPGFSRRVFREGLERMANDPRYERVPDTEYPMIRIPGYVLGFDFAAGKLYAAARKDDPHLGIMSPYAAAKREARMNEIVADKAAFLLGPERRSSAGGPQPVSALVRHLRSDRDD